MTPDEVDTGKLDIRLTANEEVMQELLILDVPTLMSVVSEFTTLDPGTWFSPEPPRASVSSGSRSLSRGRPENVVRNRGPSRPGGLS